MPKEKPISLDAERQRRQVPAIAKPQGIGNAELVASPVGFPRKAFTCRCGSPFHKILDTGRVQCGACGVIHPEIRWERRT